MTAVITIGNEILLGRTLNSNLQFLASRLADYGLPVDYAITIKDDAKQIISAFSHCWKNYDLVITTGGLGPTRDDVTKQCISEFFGRNLEHDEVVWSHVQSLFKKRGIDVPLINQSQALVPAGFEALRNDLGTAPGLLYREGAKMFLALPGVPTEMKHLFDDRFYSVLKTSYKVKPIYIRNLHSTGISESALAEILLDISVPEAINLAWLPQTGRVDLRLYGQDQDAISVYEKNILDRIGGDVWGMDEESPAHCLHKILINSGKHFAVAESCTGGLLAKMITDIPDCSRYFLGGIIGYDNILKEKALDVSESSLCEHGAVSDQVALEMLQGLYKLIKFDIGVAITGIAGPSGGSEDKPVGLVFIAYQYNEKQWVEKYIFNGERATIRHKAAEQAVIRLIKHIRSKET